MDKIDEPIQDLEMDVDQIFPNLLDDIDANNINSNEASILIHVSGYIARSLSRKLKCDQCSLQLCTSKELFLEDPSKACEYVNLLDRGGLKWPTEFVLTLATNTYLIFQKLIVDFEDSFIKVTYHKRVLLKCSLEFNLLNFEEEFCSCKKALSEVMRLCLQTMCNILLNNYVKSKNNNQPKKNESSKRKISTLTS
mgnify:CR=1 FL=1